MDTINSHTFPSHSKSCFTRKCHIKSNGLQMPYHVNFIWDLLIILLQTNHIILHKLLTLPHIKLASLSICDSCWVKHEAAQSFPSTVWMRLKLISVTSSLGLKRWRDKLILYNKLYSFYRYHGFNCQAAVAAIFAGATVRVRHLSRCTGSWASLSRLPLCIYSRHCTQRDATVWRIWWATYPQPWGGSNPFPNEGAIGNLLSYGYFKLESFLMSSNNTRTSHTGCAKQHAINPVSDVT